MVKFTVEKKKLADAVTVLVPVSNLKSFGAAPSDRTAIQLTPTTMSMITMNDANGIVVENIPIIVKDGDINTFLEKSYMVETKRFASAIKNSKEDILLTLAEETLSVGEGRKRYDLSLIVNNNKRSMPEVQMYDKPIVIKDVINNLVCTDMVTSNSDGSQMVLSGTLFYSNSAICTDRISGLYIENFGLFPEGFEDVVFPTDLFLSGVSKTAEDTFLMGKTLDNRRIVIKFGNVTLYKSLISDKFPKRQVEKAVATAKKTINEKSCKALISLKEFSDKLKEIREVVEADEYNIVFNKKGEVSIESANNKHMAKGELYIDAEVTLPDNIESTYGKFIFTHLDMLQKIFKGEDKITLSTKIIPSDTGKYFMPLLTARDNNKMLFITSVQ